MFLAVNRSEPNGRSVSAPAPPVLPSNPLSARRVAFDERTNTSLQELRSAIALLLKEPVGTGPGVLELGCGHGHYLTEFARVHPQYRCLGVDFCRDRIRRAERKQIRAGLLNLRFFRAEARQFLMSLPPDALVSQVLVLFPDPWPKRRHRKNRLVTPDLLTCLADISAPLGRFYFRSDVADYVSDVRTAVERNPRWTLLADELLPVESPTVFQLRAGSFGTVVAEVVS